MSKIYVIAANRTPVGSFGGSLKDVSAVKLGTDLLKQVIKNIDLDVKIIDEVIVGNVLSAGQGMGPGRQVSVNAGIPVEVPAYTLNMICGSGLKAVINAFSAIKAGEANVVVAAGMESMSQAPYLVSGKTRFGSKFGDMKLVDHMINDALTDVFNGYHMGVTAENIAEKYSLTREEQDELAATSQQRAEKASTSGRFKDEIIPVEIKTRKGTVVFDTDEFIRPGVTKEGLGKLRPAFKKDGTVTAANSSGINDGASVVILASEEAVKKYNLKPILEVVSCGQGGVDPATMGLGPVPASINAMEKANLTVKDIDIFELNEAFAAQALGVLRELCSKYNVTKEWIVDRTNVNGGSIAIGHPVGASGNRIFVTLIHEMLKRGSNYGLAALCIGGGMGTSVIVKKVD